MEIVDNLEVVDRATNDRHHCTRREIRHHTYFLQQAEEQLDITIGLQSLGSRRNLAVAAINTRTSGFGTALLFQKK